MMPEVVETEAQPNSTVGRESLPNSQGGHEGAVGSSGLEASVQQAPVVSLGEGEPANAQVVPVNVEPGDTQGSVLVNAREGVQGINNGNNIAEEVLKQPSIKDLLLSVFRSLDPLVKVLRDPEIWRRALEAMNGQKPPTPTPA